MSINVNDKNIGHATAYAYYKAGGGTMTEAEFTEFMADFGTASQTAVEAAQAALASQNAAQTAATTATNKASEATTAATTATNKAAEAQADADAAALDASQALSAASTATTKASEATTAAATATSAATTATTAKDDAVSAKTAAQTAQTGAETAAASVSASAAQIQTNADDISELKEDLIATNAEVTDIRVGANGVTYASAGDAVRGQYSELKNDLDSVGSHSTKSIDYTITYYKVIDSSGVVITTTSATFGVTNNIDVSDYDSLIITTTNGWGNLLYAFYKDDDTFISGEASSSSGYTTITNKQISIPSDAAYVIISKSNNPFSVSGVYPYELNIKPDFDKLKSAYLTQNIYTDISFTAVGQKYINASGQLTAAVGDTYYISDYVDISSYENVCVTASGNWGNALYAFYDASENVVSVGTIAENASAFTTIIKQNIAVPYGAKYIIVAGRTTSVMPNIQLLNGYAPAPWSNKKWVCVGDSLTEKSANATKKYYDYIADATGITAVDMGVSGSGYARKADQNQAFYQRIGDCPTDADVVTIFGSFNDLGAGLSLGSVDDTGTTTLAGCINTTIDNLQTIIPLVNLGIVAPTPWDTTQPSASGNAYDYVSMLKAICERRSIPFLDLWHCSNLRPWDADFRTIAYSHDNGSGTHPDENGHKLIAPRFKGFLETLLL